MTTTMMMMTMMMIKGVVGQCNRM